MPTLSETLLDAQNNPVSGAPVEVACFGADRSSPVFAPGGAIVKPVRVYSDAAGLWSVSLAANATLTPSDSLYRVRRWPLPKQVKETWHLMGAVNATTAQTLVDPLTEGMSSALGAHVASHPSLVWDFRFDATQGNKPGAYLINSTTLIPYPGGSGFDIILPAAAGGGVKVDVTAFVGDEPCAMILDAATLVDGVAKRWWSSNGNITPYLAGMTASASAMIESDYRQLPGGSSRIIQADEIVGGKITIRLYVATADLGAGLMSKRLFAGTIRSFYWEAVERGARYVG